MADLDFMYESERRRLVSETPEEYCRRNNFPLPQQDPTAWSVSMAMSSNAAASGGGSAKPTRSHRSEGRRGGVIDEGPLVRIIVVVVLVCIMLGALLFNFADDPVWAKGMGVGAQAAKTAGDAAA